ncbi:hypothetical protein [Longibacter sp.]|uniref:hypothetical protein n=1 Tax=Longibacter sp. TaxID=2045415 RepID=UPI003EC10A39
MSTEASSSEDTQTSSGWSARRILVAIFFVALVAIVSYSAITQFEGQPYMEVPHGDHVHYVPKDRDEDVPLSDFPTQEPAPNERILPDGRVVQVAPRAE